MAPDVHASLAAEAPAALAPAAALRSFTAKVLERAGVPQAQAASSADALLYASERGVDTHGVRNLKRYYVDGIVRGEITPAADFTVEHRTPLSMRVDGDNGLGMAACAWGMERALEMARESGVGLVAINNSNHFGAAGAYTHMAVEAGFIGISMTGSMFATGRHRAVVPSDGTLQLFGTNPLSFGFPGAEEPPFLLDMATSVVPQNRVEMLASEGLSEIPAGWAIRSDGSAATDPEAFDALLPVGGREKSTGGHKGTALAALVEAMTAVLSGAWRLHEVADIMEDDPCAPPPPLPGHLRSLPCTSYFRSL